MSDEKKRKIKLASADLSDRSIKIWGAPDEDGDQSVHSTYPVPTDRFPEKMLHDLAAYGFTQVASNSYTRLDAPTPDKVIAVLDKLRDSVLDGSWEPGRHFAESEPDDITLAIAEATGRPVHVVAKEIEERVVIDSATGQPVRDKRGRTKRVFSRAVLAEIARDPKVAPIMARLAGERAKRLAADARANKDAAPVGALDLFNTAEQQAAAAA